MNQPHEKFQQAVRRAFGPDTRVGGSLGTPSQAGDVTIHVGNRLLAKSATFAAAFQEAAREAAKMAVK